MLLDLSGELAPMFSHLYRRCVQYPLTRQNNDHMRMKRWHISLFRRLERAQDLSNTNIR